MNSRAFEVIKEDWENVKKRWEAWWDCDYFDRAIVQVTAPKNKPNIFDEASEFSYELSNYEKQWSDIDYLINKMFYEMGNTYYGGEAIPLFYHGWSVGQALTFGCEPGFNKDTIWTEPIMSREDGFPKIEFDNSNRWWKWIINSTKKASLAGKGYYYVMPCWGNQAGDNLLLIRGSQQLMYDIAENRDWAKQAVWKISNAQKEQTKELWDLVSLTGLEGSLNYMFAWSPKKTMAFDCDVSCMLSPQDFVDIFLPPLIDTMLTVDHRAYHLDGEVALHHLNTLLSIHELHAIQWVPGAGREEILQWIPLIKKIQEKGKAVQVFAKSEEVLPLLKELRPEGLCINTKCTTEDDARRLVEKVDAFYRS